MVIHEGLHNTHDLQGWRLPLSLEEGIASYVGCKGSTMYFEEHDSLRASEAVQGFRGWLNYAQFFLRHYALLTECYERGGDREEVFARLREEDPDRIHVEDDALTNAYFVRDIVYTRHTPLV